MAPIKKGGLISKDANLANQPPRRTVQGTPRATISHDAKKIQQLRLARKRVHIRRPTTNVSFCGTMAAVKIVEMEDRHDSTCNDCREEFGFVMYNGRFQ